MSSRFRFVLSTAFAALLLSSSVVLAQYRDDDEDDGIREAVARLSFVEGDVSLSRGDEPDDWQIAVINYPITLGDRVWVDRRSRAELQLRGGALFLAPESELAVLELTREVRHVSLTTGTASFRIRSLERDEVFEVSTPNASVTFESPGTYRIDVDEEGDSRISVTQGRAIAVAAGGQVLLERDDQMIVEGLERPEYEIARVGRVDIWDRWVLRRARRLNVIRSTPYVHPDVYGVDDLDKYGTWEETPDYGFVWYPQVTRSEWAPYRSGRWIWRDPWGWTWLSFEPWGWAPYHHGRWVLLDEGWAWVPVGPHDRDARYFPALVGFVGGGPGWSVSVSAGGFVGWFPLGPREPLSPWWYRARRRSAEPAARYVHRDRAVFIPRRVFVQGPWRDRDVVRDAQVLKDLSAAPVLRGPMPILPTDDSIRDPRAALGQDAATPPRRTAGRVVVTRRMVPPAPPTFARKLTVIRDRGGEPVRAEESRRILAGDRRGGAPIVPVRVVAREEVVLSPRPGVPPSRRPAPLPAQEPRPGTAVERPTPRSMRDMPETEPRPPILRGPEAPQPTPRAERAPAPVLEDATSVPRRAVSVPERMKEVEPWEPRRTRPTEKPEDAREVKAPAKVPEPEAAPTTAPRRRVNPGRA